MANDLYTNSNIPFHSLYAHMQVVVTLVVVNIDLKAERLLACERISFFGVLYSPFKGTIHLLFGTVDDGAMGPDRKYHKTMGKIHTIMRSIVLFR